VQCTFIFGKVKTVSAFGIASWILGNEASWILNLGTAWDWVIAWAI